jgi:hypothetical protein
MIATLITALMLYGIIVKQALWWEKYSTRDGGIN